MRHPTRVFIVRWTRRHWLPHKGALQWGRRIYTTPEGAYRFADRVRDESTFVEVHAYELHHVDTQELLPLGHPPSERHRTPATDRDEPSTRGRDEPRNPCNRNGVAP